MAAPTQQYPPWLTPIPTVILNPDGIPLTTVTQVIYLPLTYYGPSIPLGTEWTYGGLTSPASTSTISSTSITTTTAIPSSFSSSFPASVSSATPTSLSSISLSTLSSTTPSSISPVPSPSTTSNNASHSLSRGQLIGVIVASILGFIFISVVVILLWLCCKGRKNQTEGTNTTRQRSNFQSGLDDGYEFVEAGGKTWPEGTPRPDGDETSPFLRRSAEAGFKPPTDLEMGGRPGRIPHGAAVPRVPPPDAGNGTQSSGGSSGTNHSGYGVLVDRPTLNLLPSTTAELERQRRGPILTPEQLRALEQESVLPPGEGSLVPPPRLLDPEAVRDSAEARRLSDKSSHLSDPDAYEAFTLHYARRVKAGDLTPRSAPHLDQASGEGGSSSQNSGSLWSSLGLGRLSWFRNSRHSSRHNSRTSSVVVLSDDNEIGRALLGPTEMVEARPARRLGVGLGLDGERPTSTLSARTATSVYHDAQSSPGTPAAPGTPLSPLPPALTPGPSQQPSRPSGSGPSSSGPSGGPSGSEMRDTVPSSGMNTLSRGLTTSFDVLDTPVPAAVSPFNTTSSSSSLRDTGTDSSSVGLTRYPLPPGLTVPQRSKSWTTEGSSNATRVNVPLFVVPEQEHSLGILIDVLEEAPPSPGEHWRTLAADLGVLGGRRTTFGQFVPPPEPMSEETSPLSIYSPLSPTHSRSTGSDPRRDLSGSSRPSAFTTSRTPSSPHSLAHSGSIPSEARKRGSPAMSAFGDQPRSPSAFSPVLNAPPMAHFTGGRATPHRKTLTSLSLDADRSAMSSPEPLSPLSDLSGAPWAAGLDSNWGPADV